MKELNASQIEKVSGGGDIANGVATTFMSGGAGFAGGTIAGYAFGASWAGPVGFAVGALVGVGFVLATSDRDDKRIGPGGVSGGAGFGGGSGTSTGYATRIKRH